MINFIKNKINEIKRKKDEKRKLQNMRQYYLYLRYGALFLEYIYKDLEQQEKKNLNRHARRRWEKEISKDGKFSREMVEYYSQRIDAIRKTIDIQLKPKKKTPVLKNKEVPTEDKKNG